MLDTLLRWWATEMLGWLPAGIVRPRTDAAVATLAPDGSLLVSGRAGTPAVRFGPDAAGQAALRRSGMAGRSAVLHVPPQAVLERDVPLPLAAERNLDGVLGFEMDRLTPFAAADVHWGWSVLRRDKAAGRLLLRLHLVPKATVADALAALAGAGLVPAAIQAGERRIALRTLSPGARGRKRVLLGLGSVAAVLAVAAVALPFVLQSVRATDTEARIAALRPRVDQVEAIRRRLLAGGTDRNVVVAERARLGDTLNILAALTAVLPDDTFLSELTVRGGLVTLSGQSAAAVRLIGLIAADPVFRNPAFTAPVTRGEGANRLDNFSLRADTGSPAAVATNEGRPVR